MKIALFIKESIENSDEISTLLVSKISEYGFDFDQDNPDVVIVVGGDGTLLRAIHEYITVLGDIKFVGIHQGSLGFACGYDLNEIDELFTHLSSNLCTELELPLIEANFENDTIYAVNEIRIENPFHTLISDVLIDGELLEKFRGNGLVVSTSFGSSGYNKSLGGAVIPPNLKLMELQGIAPINNRVFQSLNSPLILSDENEVMFEGNFDDCVIGYDHLTKSTNNSSSVLIKLSNKKMTILYKPKHSYFEQLGKAFIKWFN